MRKRIIRIGIWIGSAFTVIRAAIWWIGDAETVYDVFSGRGQIVNVMSRIVLSPWFGPAIVIPCFLAYLWLEHDKQFMSRGLDTSELSEGQPAVPLPLSGAALNRKAPTATLQATERIVVDVTPEYLVGLFKDYTSVQADKLAAPYLGKWIEISGPLGDVFPRKPAGGGRYTLSVFFADRGIGFNKSYVFLQCDEAWLDRLTILPRGSNIKILGLIEKISRVEIRLGNCELVDSMRPSIRTQIPN